jgi:hypothetical protein
LICISQHKYHRRTIEIGKIDLSDRRIRRLPCRRTNMRLYACR